MDSLTDTVSLSFLRELVDWAEVDPLLTRLADVRKVTRRRHSVLCSQEFVAASFWDTCCEPPQQLQMLRGDHRGLSVPSIQLQATPRLAAASYTVTEKLPTAQAHPRCCAASSCPNAREYRSRHVCLHVLA